MRKKILSFFVLLLCFLWAQAQTGVVTYDFRDGTIITAKQSADGSLQLGGTYQLHGATYGLDMKNGNYLKIAVAGNTSVKFLGSKYSSLKMTGTTKAGKWLGSQLSKTTNDLTETYDFVYYGGIDTLIFTATQNAGAGSDIYLPLVTVISQQLGKKAATAVKNVIYSFDLRDLSIVAAAGTTTIDSGLFKIESGASNNYGYNGNVHGIQCKTGNKITLKLAGNSFIKFGGCQYSNGSVAASSDSGSFNLNTQNTKTAKCFHEDGSTVDFLYVGKSGNAVFEFTNTTYLPIIYIVPLPRDTTLTPYIQKTGTIAVNGRTISITSGANLTANAVVGISEGTVLSATADFSSIRMNLGGKALSTYTPAITGDISAVSIKNDSLVLTWANASSNPKKYVITLADNSNVASAEAGKTYSYVLYDGSVMPQTSYSSLRYTTFITKDGLVAMNSNSATTSLQLGYHDAAHGLVLFPGNSFDFNVAGNATINFVTCQYGNKNDAIFEFKDSNGNILGSCSARDTTGVDGALKSFSYVGPKGVITATLKSKLTSVGEFYLHGISVENAASVVLTSKTDVWDFGAEKLDASIYNNKLDSATINSWYANTITAGSANNVLPSFTAGVLSWVGGANDRLRTTNTGLTRYDANLGSAVGYKGRIYVNASAASGRYMSLTLSADDQVSIVGLTDAGGKLNFQYVPSPSSQTDVVDLTSNLDTIDFVAKEAGTYHIFDNVNKPSYYRIYRKDATYVTINGTVNVAEAAGIPAGYGINMKNNAGKSWNTVVSGNTFSIKVPAKYAYTLSLSNANGYVISNGATLNVTDTTSTYTVAIKKVDLYTVSGAITGLDSAQRAKLTLVYTSDPTANKIYVPSPVVDVAAATYSVQLEPGCNYTISAKGINDYFIPSSTITIKAADSITPVVFTTKPVYNITMNVTGLTADQLAKLSLKFTNLKESGYSYSFSSVNGISLRDGTYAISISGLTAEPVQMGLTSNLKVVGAATSKDLVFTSVSTWSFDDMAISNGTPAHKGLLFTGTVANEVAKGHLTAKAGATIKVPVKVGDKVNITYYYTATFTIDGGTDTIKTASNNTALFEYKEYTYTGTTAGYVTINVIAGASTSYFPEISIGTAVAYKSIVYVGANKEFKSINEALSVIAKMVRTTTERVTVMIDPGNYEEMLVVSTPNVTLKNAATTPNIALKNKGADIDVNAVRITSYYGHGYSYYSMGTNQKWNSELLRVNKENGYLSYENKGAGTTNGSYWNATVVVTANGFQADDIIFENSFNQYISKKESEDVVVMWNVGGKGIRPTAIGNTDVQKRSYVERATALAIASGDKVILNKCRIVGRQDALYGAVGSRVVLNKGAVMGAVDYIFGGMIAVFYKTDLVMNVSDVSGDVSYLTAAQQSTGRGYLMYKCAVKSAVPGVETASTMHAAPGYFGRPWQATTSEVVFYKTTVDTTNYTGFNGKSLISPAGWDKSLGGESVKMYEFGTIEKSGENNLSSRVTWATLLTKDTLTDGTAISTLNFTKGADGWDPLPAETDALAVSATTLAFTAPATTKAFDITSNVSWTVTSNQTWLTVSNISGFDNATITVSAAANTVVAARTAKVTISGIGFADKTITVTQEGVAPVLTLSTNTLSIAALASSTKTFDITSNTDWTVVSNQTWLTVSKASGNGNSTITVTAAVNTMATVNTATVTVTGAGLTAKTITVTQDAGTGVGVFSQNNLEIFPNPVVSSLVISNISTNANISIYSATGKLIMSKSAESTTDAIDVNSLSNGVYFIKVSDGKSIKTNTFIKK